MTMNPAAMLTKQFSKFAQLHPKSSNDHNFADTESAESKTKVLTNRSDSKEEAPVALIVLRRLPLPQSASGHSGLDVRGVLNQC